MKSILLPHRCSKSKIHANNFVYIIFTFESVFAIVLFPLTCIPLLDTGLMAWTVVPTWTPCESNFTQHLNCSSYTLLLVVKIMLGTLLNNFQKLRGA